MLGISANSTREAIDHEFLDCEIYAQFKFKLDSGIPNAMLNQLCDYWINFLSVMDLIYNFEATIVDHDYIIEFLTSINYLSSSYNTSNLFRICVNRI